MDAIEVGLVALTDDETFERWSRRFLIGEGHRLEARGGSKDGGRDAVDENTVYQFSIQKTFEKKLRKELKRYERGKTQAPKDYFYVTNQRIPALTKDAWIAKYKAVGITLHFYDLDQVSSLLEKPVHSGIKQDLLASTLLQTPGVIRHALQSPVRNPCLQQIESELKGSLADERLKAARAQLGATEWQRVIDTLDPLLGDLSLTPEQRYEAHLHKGNALARVDRLAEAKREWKAAKALPVKWAVATSNLATFLLMVDGDLEGAATLIDDGLRESPRDAALIDIKGNLAAAKEDWEAAGKLHEEAFRLIPRPETLLNLWAARERCGQVIAEEEVTKAREQFPDDRGVALYQANRLLERFQAGHEDQLLDEIRALLEPHLDRVVPGYRAWKRGDPPLPVFAIDRDWAACALNTYSAAWHWRRRPVEADRLLSLALHYGQSGVVLASAALAAFNVGDLPRAAGGYAAAEQAGFGNAEMWLLSGTVEFRLFFETGDPRHTERAREQWLKSAAINPDAFNNLGQLAAATGDRERAIAYLEQALAANPDHTVAHCNLARFRAAGAGDLLHRAQALELRFPDDPQVAVLLGEIHYSQGRWGEAFAHFDRAIQLSGPNTMLLEHACIIAAEARFRQLDSPAGAEVVLKFVRAGLQRVPGSERLKYVAHQLEKLIAQHRP